VWQRVVGAAGLTRHNAIGAVDRYGETARKRGGERPHSWARSIELLCPDMGRLLESVDCGVKDLRGIASNEVGQRREHAHDAIHATRSTHFRQILERSRKIVVLEVAKQSRSEATCETVGGKERGPHARRSVCGVTPELYEQVLEVGSCAPRGSNRELFACRVGESDKAETRDGRSRRPERVRAVRSGELRLYLASRVSKRRHLPTHVTTRRRLEHLQAAVIKL
jgi:hypothetical protein